LPPRTVDDGLDDVHVADPPQDVDRGQVDARQVRPHGRGARGERELVVRLVVLLAGVDVARANRLGRAVEADDLDADPDADVELLAQALRRLEHQPGALLDHLADVVRQAAVREPDMVPALEHDDVGELVQAARPGRARDCDTAVAPRPRVP